MNKRFDCGERFVAYDMFDTAGILGGDIDVNADADEIFGKHGVAFVDLFGNALSFLGKSEPTVV